MKCKVCGISYAGQEGAPCPKIATHEEIEQKLLAMRQWAEDGGELNGADAQALEGALQEAEEELSEARKQIVGYHEQILNLGEVLTLSNQRANVERSDKTALAETLEAAEIKTAGFEAVIKYVTGLENDSLLHEKLKSVYNALRTDFVICVKCGAPNDVHATDCWDCSASLEEEGSVDE